MLQGYVVRLQDGAASGFIRPGLEGGSKLRAGVVLGLAYGLATAGGPSMRPVKCVNRLVQFRPLRLL